MKKRFLIIVIILGVLYICSYLFVKSNYSKSSSIGNNYILLQKEKSSHKFMHYFFYPAFWIDYKFTGQEYGIATPEDPYWIFAN